MTTSTPRNECANAEIIGVVILIGMFAIMAGILSATVFATPEPAKVPAASIEITGSPGAIHVAHLGGDPVALEYLVVRGMTADGTIEERAGSAAQAEWLPGLSGEDALNNGFSDVSTKDWNALVMSWKGSSGESVIASWDPNGIYGPLGASTPSGVGPAPYVTSTQLPMPTATTNWSSSYNLTAGFTISSITGPTFYAGFPITFTDTSADTSTGLITNWTWTFGDLKTSTLQSPEHTYDHGETYYVSLTVSNYMTGASDTVVKRVDVLSGATPGRFTFDVTPTVGYRELTVTCSDPTTFSHTIWQWKFTDPVTGVTFTDPKNLTEAEGRSQTHTFYNTGTTNKTCYIDLTAWSPYVSEPIVFEQQPVIVAPPLRADFDMNRTIGVSPQAVKFLDKSVGLPETYAWDFESDGTIDSTDPNPIHIFTVGPDEIRNFSVTLTVDRADSEPDSVTKYITIWPPVVAHFTANVTEGEAPLTVQFTDLSSGWPTGWRWYFGETTIESSTERNPVFTFTSDGTYGVTLLVERATDPNPETHSADIETIPIFIRVGPEVWANFTADPTEGVEPLTVSFTDTSVSADPAEAPIHYWTWDFGDGSPIIAGKDPAIYRNPTHLYATAGTYIVTLTAENDYRLGTATQTITVRPKVTTDFTSNVTAVPVNGVVAFEDTSTSGAPITGWLWDFGDGTPTSTDRHPMHTYTTRGSYSVSLTASNAFHSVTVIKTGYITVFNPVTADFTTNQTSGPAPLWVQFTDASTGDVDAWYWVFDDDGDPNSTLQNSVGKFVDPGDYEVSLTAWNQTRPDINSTKQVTIHVDGPPTASFTTDTATGAAPLLVTFTDTSTGTPLSWSWDFGDSTTDTVQNPTHSYATAGTYTATLQVVNPAGTSTTTQTITVT